MMMRWVIGLAFFIVAHPVYAMGGLNPSCMAPLNGIAEPAPAVANAFNCARIAENFGSASSIDINNSGGNQYTWKAQIDPTHNILPSSGLTFNNPGITLGNPNRTLFPGLFSASSPNSNGVMVGKTFGNGGYFEANLQADPAQSLTSYRSGSASWPDFVFTSYSIFIQNSCPPGTEIDNFEYLPSPTTNGVVIPAMAIGQFAAGSPCGAETFNTPNNTPSITIDANPHRFGRLWLTKAQNGGTGLYGEYFDGNHLTTQCGGGSCDTTYTTGNFSDAEGTPQVLEIAGGPGSFTSTIRWVQAWTR